MTSWGKAARGAGQCLRTAVSPEAQGGGSDMEAGSSGDGPWALPQCRAFSELTKDASGCSTSQLQPTSSCHFHHLLSRCALDQAVKTALQCRMRGSLELSAILVSAESKSGCFRGSGGSFNCICLSCHSTGQSVSICCSEGVFIC